MKRAGAGEVLAASYFSCRGDNIYWPLPGYTKCDFIREDSQGNIKKVQVKYASWSHKKGDRNNYLILSFVKNSRNKSSNPYEHKDFDELMCLSEDGRAWLIPYYLIKDKKSICLYSSNPNYNYEKKGLIPDFWLLEDFNYMTYKERDI